jgi:hypothetical protein
MKYYKKYTFDSKQQADDFINALPTIEEDGVVYPDYGHTIVRLGHLPIEYAVYDEDLNEISPGIYSDKYSVDVLWKGLDIDENGDAIFPSGWVEKELSGLDSYKHNFYGLTYE